MIVNPAGGKGRAVKAANNVIRPILEAAGCSRIEVIRESPLIRTALKEEVTTVCVRFGWD